MKDLISKIYDRVAYSEPRSQELNLEYDQFIDKDYQRKPPLGGRVPHAGGI